MKFLAIFSKARREVEHQLFDLCQFAAKITEDVIPHTNDENNPCLWLNIMARPQGYLENLSSKDYKKGAFDLMDRIARLSKFGVEFLRCLSKLAV